MISSLPLEIRQFLIKRKLALINIVRTPDNGLIRSYVLEVSRKSKKYAVKYFWSQDEQAKIRFEREIFFLLNKDSYPKNIKKHLPSLKWCSNSESRGYWMILDWEKGESLGNFLEDMGIKKGKFSIEDFKKVQNFFGSFYKIKLQKGTYGFYDMVSAKHEIWHYHQNNPEIIENYLWKRVDKFINSKHLAFNKTIISHLDLYPENFVIQKNTLTKGTNFNFTLLDWEHVSKVPVGWDPAFLGTLFWRENIWQNVIYSEFYDKFAGKSRIFNLSYRVCTVILCLRFMYQITAFANGKQNDDKVSFKTFLHLRLQNALSGKLVSPDDVKFLLSVKVINKILIYYNIGTFKSFALYYLSRGNTVFKVVTSEGSYIFRIYNLHRSLAQIKNELFLFKKLYDNKIPSYNTILNKKGLPYSRVYIYGLYRKVTVLSYIKGGTATRHEIKGLLLVRAGEMLKRIHLLSVSHGDYSKRNVLFCKGRISGVLDLEYGRNMSSDEELLEDLAKSVALWCMSVSLGDINIPDRVTSFLKGYWGQEFSILKMKKLLPKIIRALDIESKIHTKLHKGGGESFAKIKEELVKLQH